MASATKTSSQSKTKAAKKATTKAAKKTATKKAATTKKATSKASPAKKNAKKTATKKATTQKTTAKKAAKKTTKKADTSAAKASSPTKKTTSKTNTSASSKTKKATKKTAKKASKATAKKTTTKAPTTAKKAKTSATKKATKKSSQPKRKTIRKTKVVKEKAAKIREILDELYPETPIPLTHEDPYTLLVAVLLSAQCTDARVNQITPSLFARAKTPQDMIELSVEEIAGIIKPCGLSARKSKAIWNLSQQLLDEYDGEVPASLEAMEQLPGVGHKTASVVMTQAFDMPAFPVDTHIHRLATRWKLTSGRDVIQTEADLKSLYPEEIWGALHLRIIFFGREYCPARSHDPEMCPICSWAA